MRSLLFLLVILVVAALVGGNTYNAWFSPYAKACTEAGGFIYWRTAALDQSCVKAIQVPR